MDVGRAIDAWLDQVPVRRTVLEIVRAAPQKAYLVGGTVRDALLGRDSDDLDLAVDGRAMALARQVADRIGGAYVVMDAERDVARVLRRAGGRRQQFDFAGLRAEGIVADLWARDYTVNAMALLVSDPWGEILDPAGGRADLEARRLRAVSDDAFRDDPVRILRGVRLAGALGFALTADTEILVRAWLPALERVSAERIRDEWLAILALDPLTPILEMAFSLGVARRVLPEAGEGAERWARRLGTVSGLVAIENAWRRGGVGPWVGLAPRLAERSGGEFSPGRTRGVLLRLAGLLPEGDNPLPVAVRLRLSSRETRFVVRTVRAAREVLSGRPGGAPGALGIYRYYRTFGEDGLEGAVLALAHAGSLPAVEARVLELLDAWFRQREWIVDPPRLLDGGDVVRLLGGETGPRVGALLESVREAQVRGLVQSREEALAHLRNCIG